MPKRAIVYINEEEIHHALSLPDGLKIIGVSIEWQRLAIAVMIEGDQLPESDVGTMLPEYLDESGERWRPILNAWVNGYRQALEDMENKDNG